MSEKDRGGANLNYLQMEFPAMPENLGLARVAVASFAAQLDLTLNDMEELKVATSEAVSNCIIHGYNNESTGKVWVSVHLYPDYLEIIVKDAGKGIEDIEKAMEAAYSSDPERMGLGFVFMKSFMDDVQVESELGNGTTVRMTKDVVIPSKDRAAKD